MSNQDNYREMIDAYLTGNLKPEDSDRLMESLGQDPALKEEFLLQKDLVQSLQNKRRAELKNRLNQIEVGTGYSLPSALSYKFIAGAALVALLGAGTYFALNQAEDTSDTASVFTQAQETHATPAPEIQGSDKKEEAPDLPSSNGTETGAEEAKEATVKDQAPEKALKPETRAAAETKKPKVAARETKEVKEPQAAPAPANAEVVKPEVITFFDEQDPAPTAPLAEAPEDKLKNSGKFDNQNIEVSTKTDIRYPFHYMFFENQLSIYGDFSTVPYEVLEVNTGRQASYFLFHKGKYYELNPNQRKVTRLKELTNERLIRELEVTRNEKLKH